MKTQADHGFVMHPLSNARAFVPGDALGKGALGTNCPARPLCSARSCSVI